MRAITTGNITSSAPQTSSRCEKKVRAGRRSIMRFCRGRRWMPSLVLHLLLHEAELDDRQGDHDGHEDDRLRRRAVDVQRLEAVVVDLVDQDGGFLARSS